MTELFLGGIFVCVALPELRRLVVWVRTQNIRRHNRRIQKKHG